MALDAATEWYFADGSSCLSRCSTKTSTPFPLRQSRRGTFASTGLPRSVIQPYLRPDVSPDGEGTCGDPAGCWTIGELSMALVRK
jgi:hypothetical protein